MSNLIPKLKAAIKAIEDTVTSDMDKLEVYDKLIEAYNLHKDIIALYEDSSMEIQDTTQITDLQEQVRVLEAWKDGANLEGEKLKEKLVGLTTELHETYIENTELEANIKAVGDKLNIADNTIQSLNDKLDEIAEIAK